MRARWVLGILLCMAPALQALDVQVGNFFQVIGITQKEGRVVLPAERKKYHNVRILDKKTYDWVVSCKQDCKQPAQQVEPLLQEIRAAKSRPDMWIVQVNFNKQWLVTFLVFKHEKRLDIKAPQHFLFLEEGLRKRTYEVISQAIAKETT